ncbi:MAG: hypothetical protein GY724_16800 [Actinomycetia bacterium]|nr:hypothetical protein [Actinomycetes bacterium]
MLLVVTGAEQVGEVLEAGGQMRDGEAKAFAVNGERPTAIKVRRAADRHPE